MCNSIRFGVQIVVLLTLAGVASAQPIPLFGLAPSTAIQSAQNSRSPDSPEPAARRSRLATMALDQLDRLRQTGGGTLTLNLFGDVVFPVEFSRVTETDRGYSVSGRVVNDFGSGVVIVVHGEVVTGSVISTRGTYSIDAVAPAVYEIRELDESTFPPDDPPELPDMSELLPAVDSVPPALRADDGSVIDVLAMYTPAAWDWADTRGVTGGIFARIEYLAEMTNLAYENSGVRQRIRLVGIELAAYEEASDTEERPGIGIDLRRLARTDDGWMDYVHGLRDYYAADLVHLFVNSPSYYGGVAFLPRTVEELNPLWAFGVTQVWTHLTLAHELGHNMGLWHDRYQVINNEDASQNEAIAPYGFGYVNQASLRIEAMIRSLWRTVMAYTVQCNDTFSWVICRRMAAFSNPTLTYWGEPAGVPGTVENNAVFGPANASRLLNETAIYVANYKDSSQRVVQPPTAGDTVEATTVIDIRTRIDEVRDWCGLNAAAWTDQAIEVGVTPIRAVHITEPRSALAQAYTACGRTAPAWTDPQLQSGMPIRAVHFSELLEAARTIQP